MCNLCYFRLSQKRCFGLSRHCVTFPQDITKMCDELPQRKGTLLKFIRNIGNKDTLSIFPTKLAVDRQKVVDALLWLKKHNPVYRTIKSRMKTLTG